jgi:alpha-galactosidase
MLEVGQPGLTLTEQKSHFSAWAIMAAPLLISADLVSGIANDTLAILAAPEVIAVDQDPLGVQGTRVSPANATGVECWAKPLADGAVAALLLNRGAGAADITCTWTEMGLPAGAQAEVRDLWARADLGAFTGSYTAAGVESHGVVMVKVTPKA